MLLFQNHGKSPCVLVLAVKSPGVHARLSGIFHRPPTQGSHGMEGSRGLGHTGPLFVWQKFPYSEPSDVGRVLDPVNYQKTPPAPLSLLDP